MTAIKNKYQIVHRYTTNKNSRPELDPRNGKASKRKFAVSHDTGNEGSTAEQNVKYYNTKNVVSSVHAFIDDKIILQIVPFAEKVYGVQYQKGYDDLRFGAESNDSAIQAELCWGGNINFAKAYDRFVWYWAYVFKMYAWKDVKKLLAGHFQLDPQRRTDPVNAFKRYGVTYGEFLNDVQNYVDNWDVDPDKATSEMKTHKVEKGDTLWSIAHDNGTSVKAIADLNDINPNGVLSVGTVLRLGGTKITPAPSKPAPKPIAKPKYIVPTLTLRRGDSGPQVTLLQKGLDACYFLVGDNKGEGIDGKFGPATEDALERFQSVYANPADGVYGNETEKALAKRLEELY
jgi:N-acetylmuramoyl-L-alanine amidase